MNREPLVSLLMPNYNRRHLLDDVLEHLARNTTYPNVELIVVDDGSTDGSADVLRRWERADRFPELKLIEKPNSGAIDSLNTALNAATGEFCVQLDSDVTIQTSGWVERMLELMMVDDAVGVVTSKVVLDSGEIHCCGVDVVGPEGWHDRPARPDEPLGRRRWITRATHPMEGDGGAAESEPAEVDAGIGCCMMYRRADALEVGGYDTRWSPVWFDDVDLCLKIRVLGRKVFYLPDVRVIHHFTGRREAEPWHARLKPRRLRRALMRRTGKHLPFPLRDAIERRFVVDTDMHFSKSQVLLLRRHLASWQEKWGWDARNPDMAEVQRRWGDTEVCWALDPARRAAGERILAAYEPRRRELDSQFMAAV